MAITVTYNNTPIINPNQTIDEFLAAFDNAYLNAHFPDTAGKTAADVWAEVTTELNSIRASHGMVEVSTSDTQVVQTYPSQADKDAAETAVQTFVNGLPKSESGVQAKNKDGTLAYTGTPQNKTPVIITTSAYQYINELYFNTVKKAVESIN
jgi:hypothetical protein